MSEPESASIGARIRSARKLAGITQDQLAARAHVSKSLVKQVEQARTPASPAFIAAAARVLQVSPAELQHQPYWPSNSDAQAMHATIPPLRRELSAYCTSPDDDVRPRSLGELADAVARASAHRHNVNLAALGSELPGLLAELRAATWLTQGSDKERAYWLLAETYYAASQTAYKLGYIDLASLAVDRYEWAATRCGDELAILVGDYQRAGEMIGAADWNGARRFLAHSQARIEDEIHRDDLPTLAIWGNLHLKSALAAARGGDEDSADDHLTEARETAERIGVDRDDYRLCFGPTNVDIWSVGLAVEARNGTRAVQRADSIRLPTHTPRERAGHHWIDLARGYQLHGDRDRALATLQQARTTSPQQARYHPQVRETVVTLAEHDRRRDDTLAGFARWAGIQL